MLGNRHPAALGIPFSAAWPEIWEEIEPLVERVFGGETVRFEEMPLVMTRHGYTEDTWWNFSYSPVRDELQSVVGLLNVTAEATGQVRAKRAEAALRDRAAWLRSQKEAFQAAMNDRPLSHSLGILARMAAEQVEGRPKCAFYIVDAEAAGLHHVTGMPDDYARHVEGFEIGPDSLACGLAAYTRAPVITPDIREEPRWRSWMWLAEKYGHRACWSFPVETAAGRVVGTFAMYFDQPRDAGPRDRELAAALTDAASIIISRHEQAEERARAEQALRESEERQAFLLQFSDALRAQPDAEAMAEHALRLLAEHLRIDRAYIARFFPGEDRLTVAPEYRRDDLAPIAGEMRPSDFPEGFRLASEGTVVVNDSATDPMLTALDRRSLAAIDFVAFIVAGLRKGEGNLAWVLGAATTEPRLWTPGEIALVEDIAERTWGAMEAARAEAALGESEKRYRTLFETMDEGFVVGELLRDAHGTPVDFRYLEVNPALERLAGWKADRRRADA